MENKENFQNKEEVKNPLAQAYFEIHQKEPYNNEVHMDQIEYVYNKWKEKQKYE